jgi:hypothetical protein
MVPIVLNKMKSNNKTYWIKMINLNPYYKLLKANYLFLVVILAVSCIFVYMILVLYNKSYFNDVSNIDYTQERIFYIPVIMGPTTPTVKV